MRSVKLVVTRQAEDGIRDRSPSRGLGDVYKRQVYSGENVILPEDSLSDISVLDMEVEQDMSEFEAVSYTHLTLPTIYSV